MRRGRIIGIHLAWMIIFLCSWFLYLTRNAVGQIESSMELMEYISINVGYNYMLLHGSVYAGLYFFLLSQMLPRMDEQILTRMLRSRVLKKQVAAAALSAVMFCTVFCAVHLVMVLMRSTPTVLFGTLQFGTAWMLNWIRMCEIYFLFGMIWILIYSVLGKREIAFAITICGLILCFFAAKQFGIFQINGDLAVYHFFYEGNGLDLLDYFSRMLKHAAMILGIYLVSGVIFERKDWLK